MYVKAPFSYGGTTAMSDGIFVLIKKYSIPVKYKRSGNAAYISSTSEATL
jgi:hypothetical protein